MLPLGPRPLAIDQSESLRPLVLRVLGSFGIDVLDNELGDHRRRCG